jgi:hypothetical protein
MMIKMMKYEFNDAYLAVHYKFITGFTSATQGVTGHYDLMDA